MLIVDGGGYSLDEHQSEGVTALTIILLLILIQATCKAQASHEVEFYIFGSMGCPACRDLKETLTQAYGEGSLTFRDVSIRENGEKLLALYSIIYPEIKEYSIPLTIIVIDDELAGSAIGAMDTGFWQYMINESLKTGKFMIADGDGKIYVADRDLEIMAEIARIIGLGEGQVPPATKDLTQKNFTQPFIMAAEPGTATTDMKSNTGSPTTLTNYITMITATTLLAAAIIYNVRRSRSKR